uniref:Uncharacterized protein n=1 Tax=Romanomermis culicivorax TaxID=13658 RepID=A0A915IVT3_ROMCU
MKQEEGASALEFLKRLSNHVNLVYVDQMDQVRQENIVNAFIYKSSPFCQIELQDVLPLMKTLQDLKYPVTQIDIKYKNVFTTFGTKDKPIVVNQVVATEEEKCQEIAFVGNAQYGSKKYNQTKARPQNQLQKAVEDQRSDGNGEEMQPGPSTRDIKQT